VRIEVELAAGRAVPPEIILKELNEPLAVCAGHLEDVFGGPAAGILTWALISMHSLPLGPSGDCCKLPTSTRAVAIGMAARLARRVWHQSSHPLVEASWRG
jgi:hypothetical protein